MRTRSSYCTVFLFFLILFVLGSLFWLLPDRTFSTNENRSLAGRPRWTIRRFFSGEVADATNDYYADQFPARDAFVRLKALCELALGRGENDGILLGRGGQLARRRFAICRADGEVVESMDRYDEKLLDASIQGILRTEASLKQPFTVLLTGRSIDVVADAFDYPDDYSRALCSQISRGLSGSQVAVDTIASLRRHAATGEEVYYRTDHHWTMLGAYYAYCELLSHWGMGSEILPMDFFTRVTAEEPFYGTAYSAAGWSFVAPDSLELWYGEDEGEYVIRADGKALSGFYSTRHLSSHDGYATYLDGVHEIVTVEHSGGGRPRLLLFKDSFANSIAPFLARHFDLVLLNLSSTRTDYTDFSYYAREYDADRVLLLYTLENVITTDTLSRLR